MFQTERLEEMTPERLKVTGPVVFPETLAENVSIDLTVSFADGSEAEVRQILATVKQELFEMEDKSHSRLFIAAFCIVEYFSKHNVEQAQHNLDLNDLDAFALEFDLASGAQFLVGSIVLVESHISGTLKDCREEMDELILRAAGDNDDIDFEGCFSNIAAIADRFVPKLMEDPSGFTTVDGIIEYLDEHFEDLPSSNFRIKPAFLAGAKTAAVIYKAVYPLTDNL